jgi:hypothetical protein
MPPSENERSQLRQFVRLVHEMRVSRFIRTAESQDHSIRSNRLDDGLYRITTPDYDLEDFRSFLTLFRQVALSKAEPVYASVDDMLHDAIKELD